MDLYLATSARIRVLDHLGHSGQVLKLHSGVAVSMVPWSQCSPCAMRMRASAVLQNKVSAWSELSPFSRCLPLLHKHTKSLQNLLSISVATFKMVLQPEPVI